MSEITLFGTLEMLREQALAVSEVVKLRDSEGWPVFQADEMWLYETEMDDRVCPACEAYGVQRMFRGDSVPVVFPYYEFVTPFVVKPHTHMPDLSLFHWVECRCLMFWQNPLECLERRLHDEKLRGLGL